MLKSLASTTRVSIVAVPDLKGNFPNRYEKHNPTRETLNINYTNQFLWLLLHKIFILMGSYIESKGGRQSDNNYHGVIWLTTNFV
jgi:hypothetical protein